jgi:solute carrier family 25 carnitine/acylcarnitine transporter 20/29
MEHVRTRLQVQAAGVKVYTGPGDFIFKVYKQWGLKGLFKGQMITLAREFHGYGIYFMVYEALIQKVLLSIYDTHYKSIVISSSA